ncbi:unnamed protein product [Fraxinus pennsylvanica]|uniref:Uncharacterized protein n=1 Tax=Fraxinus pennsylvanica TaxID=56036 RepID=A0AAD2DQS0_9LAMI|nr:unnamed protein product [Fraxinus pennsylvanica]
MANQLTNAIIAELHIDISLEQFIISEVIPCCLFPKDSRAQFALACSTSLVILDHTTRSCLCSLFVIASLICSVYFIGSAWLGKYSFKILSGFGVNGAHKNIEYEDCKVVIDKDGVLEQMNTGKGYIDMSTVHAETSSKISEVSQFGLRG